MDPVDPHARWSSGRRSPDWPRRRRIQAAVTVTQVNAGSEGAERNLYYAGNYGSTNLYNGDFIDPNFKVFNVTENRSSDTTGKRSVV